MATTDGPTPTTFEDRLLVELTGLVNEQAIAPTPDLVARRRGVRRPVLLAGAAAVVAAAAALVVLPGVIGGKHGASSGYAVDRQSGGTISFSVRGLVGDTASAQSALQTAGAGAVRVVSSTGYQGRCHISARNASVPSGLLSGDGPNSFVIDPTRLPRGEVLIVAVPTRDGAPVSVSLSRDGTPPCER